MKLHASTALVALLLATAGNALSDRGSSCLASREGPSPSLVRVGERSFMSVGQGIVPIGTTGYCASCHDGTVAGPVHTRFAASARTSAAGPGVHPVDVLYPAGRPGFRAAAEIDPRLVLEGGKVTCLTCHGGGGQHASELSMPNTGSRLCLSCHVK